MPGPAGPSPKLLGRLAAALLALIFAGIVWWSISRTTPTAQTPNPLDSEPVPDITDLVPGAGESIIITLADREDPGRVAGLIEVDRFDPIGNGERELLNPRGWLYPRGGRVVRVQAERGVLAMPAANSTPESGTLSGNVRVAVYDTQPVRNEPPPDDAVPVMTATFDEPVHFESRYLRLTTTGAFLINSERATFEGTGLAVMLNGVRDRIELVDVDHGGRLTVRDINTPDNNEQSGTPTPPTTVATTPATHQGTPPASPPSGSQAQAVTQPAIASDTDSDPLKIDRYHIRVRESVVASMGSATVQGDRLELFARVTDNQLPTDALAPVRFVRTSPAVPPDPSPHSSRDSEPDAAPAPRRTAASLIRSTPRETASTNNASGIAPPGESLILTWEGPMTIRPFADDDQPEQLAADDAAMEFFEGDNAPVVFRDDSIGLDGSAGTLTYAATRVVFGITQSDDQPAVVTIQDAARAAFAQASSDLRTGVIDFTGPGNAETRDAATLAWDTSGSLAFRVDDGAITDRLERARFEGAVRIEQQDGSIRADQLAATFGVGDDGRAALRAADLTNGSIRANPDPLGRPRVLEGGMIRAAFAGNADDLYPVRVEAVGTGGERAIARANGSELRADRAVASLVRDDTGLLAVHTADASGSVEYLDDQDTTASGHALHLEGSTERIRITGAGSHIAQRDSRISGQDIRLDGLERRMEVEGAGTFTHALRDDAGLPVGRVVADWARSMRFDDALGRLECLGAVTVTSARDALSRDKLEAERIEVEMTPRLAPQRLGQTGQSARTVRIARAFGGATADQSQPARAETQRFDPTRPEFAEGLLYLEGDQIIADAERSELRVPGPGTLLVLDRRADTQPSDQPSPTDAGNSDTSADPPVTEGIGPGLTRFTWGTSMTLDREQGVGEMVGSVFVRHKTIAPAGGSSLVDLLCDRLTARFSEGSVPAGSESPSFDGGSAARLQQADAQGGVVFVSNERRLEADGARFEPEQGLLHALALPGGLVTLREPGRPAPLSARAIRWDLTNDQIEINRPSPVLLPN